MAVRYVVLTQQVAPGADAGEVTAFAPALDQQLDLRQLQSQPGARVYENVAWVPGDAVVSGRVPRLAPHAPLGTSTGRIDERAPVRGTVLWSQSYDDAWEATNAAGDTLTRRRAFGWSTAFAGRGSGPVSVSFTDQWWRWPILALELVIVVLVGQRVLSRGRRRRRRAREAAAAAADGASS